MFSNYFKSAFRNLLRYKSLSLINLTGLVVGFSAFLLIFLVLSYEESFDNFHPAKDRLYRVVRIGKGAVRSYRTGVPFPVTEALRQEYPQVENAAAICSDGNVQVIIPGVNGEAMKKFKEARGVFFAEQRFFDLFDFRIVKGDPAHAITEPNTAVLTRTVATKYFGGADAAMGQIIKVDGSNVKVTGIVNDPPANTDFPLEIVLSYPTLNPNMTDWVSITDNNYCFVRLPADYPAARFDALLPSFISKHMPPEHAGYDLVFQPLKEMHFDSRFGNFNGRTFGKDLITALSLIGLFLLIVACVNFINLSTAYAVNRAKEVGVRKVLGSGRGQLMLQFFGETGIICAIAIAGAVIVALVCLPFLNRLLGVDLSLGILLKPAGIFFLLSALLLVTLLSGFYPALVLAGFNPINALKSRVMTGPGKGVNLRRGLVVFQFVIAQVLIIGTLVVVAQMDYFSRADMGFSKEAIVNASFPTDSLGRSKMDLLRDQLNRLPGIKEISLSMFAPTGDQGWATDLQLGTNHTKKADLVVNMKPADTAYFRLYGLQLAAGRVYFPSDSVREFVVNETLVNKLNLGSPQQVIGKSIRVAGSMGPIVGVVKDFHMHSLRDKIDELVMMNPSKRGYQMVNIKIEAGKIKTALAGIEAIWNKDFPDYVFEYHFIDQTVADYYKQENQLSQLYKIAAGTAIFISCLGLYGLIGFMAVRRRKEIGIRKVLGAPARNIVLLLSREFTLLIAISFLIASPLAWYFMQEWLQQYSYRISLTANFFLLAFLSSLLIAWLTVGHSAIKAALANPVTSLRTE